MNNRITMRKALTVFGLLSLILMMTACRQSASTDIASDFTIDMVVEPDEPTVGQSNLVITIQDGTGSPVSDAIVTIRGDMAHAGMVPETADAVAVGDGTYQAALEWTMAGDWVVTVTATLPDGRIASREFPLAVATQ